jgi:hypothetical protein
MCTSRVDETLLEEARNNTQLDGLHFDGINRGIRVASKIWDFKIEISTFLLAVEIIRIQSSKPQELKDLFDHRCTVTGQLKHFRYTMIVANFKLESNHSHQYIRGSK